MAIRVLIADSDEPLLSSYRDVLSKRGFEVVTATNGLDCVAQLRTLVPDVLVLALDLPWGGADGVLAMMHERSDVPLVPVMVLSARHNPQSLSGVLGFTMMSDYHIKPLGADQLASLIPRVLENAPPPSELKESTVAINHRTPSVTTRSWGDTSAVLYRIPQAGVES